MDYINNGQLEEKSTYDNDGNINGLHEKWYEDGQLSESSHFCHGLRQGLCQEWYDNGHKHIECKYYNGQRSGLFRMWYPNGQLELECNYTLTPEAILLVAYPN